MRFDFVERKGYKYRPVIVLDVAEDIALTAATVTGVETRLSFPHDYVLADWQKEGLAKPSLVRLDKIALIPLANVGTARKIGELSRSDKIGLQDILESLNWRSINVRPRWHYLLHRQGSLEHDCDGSTR